MYRLRYIGEVWRPVVGYEGLYEVSNFGRVRRLVKYVKSRWGNYRRIPEIIMKTRIDSRGYVKVGLVKNNVQRPWGVHQLVARAFPEICGEWFEGCVVNHKDENPLNNVATNLEHCTQEHNVNYGTGNIKRSLSQSKACGQYKDGVLIKTFVSSKQAYKETGIWWTNINRCCGGKDEFKRKTAGGYEWRYL